MERLTVRTRFLTLALIAPALAACETSMRLAPMSNPFGSSDRLSPPPAVEQPRIEAAPAPRVEAAPLPPPVQSQSLPPPPGASGEPQMAQPGLSPGVTPGGPSAPAPPGTQQQASAPPPPPPVENAAPTRNSVTGNWSAREASGGSCRVTLSSVSKLDLYGASTSGCQSKDLQKVTAWELRGDDVYLYEPGGTVAARLKARGGQISGTLSKSGAPITLSK